MFRHLLKLTWKRKSRNLMLSLEILLAFVVVFALAAYAIRCVQLYRLPVGFSHEHVWVVSINTGNDRMTDLPGIHDTFKRSIEQLPEVEQVAFATLPPYTRGSWTTFVEAPSSKARVMTETMNVTDDFFAVMGMKLAEGRWFSRLDDGAADVPVVINRALASKLFPGEAPLDKQFKNGDSMMKVVGVVDEYRSRGELSAPGNFALKRFSESSEAKSPPSTILIKLKPGVNRVFETELNDRLQLVRNNWSYQVSPVRGLRETMLKEDIVPLIILAIIGTFMLVMVAFGLFGVLWQNTSRRIPEIGLRRALGATAVNIYRQIVAEQILLSSGAMLVALILLAQLPLTGAIGNAVNWPVFAAAAAISMAVIYLISLLCALYPGWRASRLSPTEALHYE